MAAAKRLRFFRPSNRRVVPEVAGLENVTLEDDALVAQALNWTERGMDFADALHLGRTQGCSAFVSFDRKLAKLARAMCGVPVATP